MRRAYVAFTVLITVFSMAWYKIVMERSLVVSRGLMEYPTCHLSLECTEKTQVTRRILIFHGALLVLHN